MTRQEIQATLTISLLAAYADSHKHEREREEIRRIAEGLAATEDINLPSLYQDVLFRRTNIHAAAASLSSDEARQLAYEMAVCVCEADGSTSEREQAFLKELHEVLGLTEPFSQKTLADGQAMAEAPLAVTAANDGWGASGGEARAGAASPAAASPGSTSVPASVPSDARRPSTLSTADIDSRILRAAITNGAIELLPESLSTLAIIPLQMRLVYQIGESYGYTLDKGHIRDLLATVGIGMTSQYLEQAGRKLLGGLLGKKLGRSMLGKVGKQAVSSGMSFASTYALGHVANQYYAGGRTLSTQMLKNTYNHVLQKGQSLQTQYLPEMQAQASTLDAGKVMAMVRGQG
ncbi:MAG: TerB family tellurite resistance protein [Lautropia sp.]|nr:TerB family tellurite resistance protein [Lautropia sp.]